MHCSDAGGGVLTISSASTRVPTIRKRTSAPACTLTASSELTKAGSLALS